MKKNKIVINLTKEVLDMETTNYKTFLREIQEELKLGNIQCSWIGKFSIVINFPQIDL